MNKLEVFMKKHSSMLLSVASGIGLVTTTVLAIKATPKALELIEEEKKEQDDGEMRHLQDYALNGK